MVAKAIDDEKMQELVESIKANGVLSPVIVRPDDEAVILMVDANIQREEILPSERAYSFKMKMEAMKRQGSRHDLTSGLQVHKLNGEITSGLEVQKFLV